MKVEAEPLTTDVPTLAVGFAPEPPPPPVAVADSWFVLALNAHVTLAVSSKVIARACVKKLFVSETVNEIPARAVLRRHGCQKVEALIS
jgi:hypothetical protein